MKVRESVQGLSEYRDPFPAEHIFVYIGASETLAVATRRHLRLALARRRVTVNAENAGGFD